MRISRRRAKSETKQQHAYTYLLRPELLVVYLDGDPMFHLVESVAAGGLFRDHFLRGRAPLVRAGLAADRVSLAPLRTTFVGGAAAAVDAPLPLSLKPRANAKLLGFLPCSLVGRKRRQVEIRWVCGTRQHFFTPGKTGPELRKARTVLCTALCHSLAAVKKVSATSLLVALC